MLDQMLYVDTKTWLPDDLLVKADKMTMAASTELRVPLLDVRVLEFAASLPETFKVKNRATKRLLKATLAARVPPEILNRTKAGFPVPYESWLRRELGEFVRGTLLSRDAAVLAYFDRKQLTKAVQQSLNGAGSGKALFSLLVLELWHEQFLASSTSAAASAVS
jgi:asparagine synthase (glutamine-hydrolysing)